MLLWLILLLPLASFAVIGLFLLNRPRLASMVSAGTAVTTAILALAAIWKGNSVEPAAVFSWLRVSHLRIDFTPEWDRLAQLMTFVVTFVGALIHVYSLGYMKNDAGKARFFAYMSLFMFSMQGIVLAGNFVVMFVFWELVGLSSYLLIGFWYEKPGAAEAGKKALLVNKLGDFGFMVGILMVWSIFQTVDFQRLGEMAWLSVTGGNEMSAELKSWLMLMGLLLFCGVAGKSAQLPLHVWLPDAMEGPTPVSALIHAATMVAAGVYMLCRIFFFLAWIPDVLTVIAWVGGATALFAALCAVAQDDIKRVLAYSTMSQLGLMVMGVGLGGPAPAMFHLTTHAFFKALLFLAAGSVLVALHHEQNIWRMGGLRAKLPVTFLAFLAGMLALSGVPGLSGFFSKDEILMVAFARDKVLFGVGTAVSFLTAFYMTRLMAAVFAGRARSEAADHARETPAVMLMPLVILALLSVAAGYSFLGVKDALRDFAGFASAAQAGHSPLAFWILAGVPFAGIAAGWLMYRDVSRNDALACRAPLLHRLLAGRLWFDELYDALVRHGQGGLTTVLNWFDTWVVDCCGVKGVSLSTMCLGNLLRCFHSGNLQTYLIYLSLALVILIFWKLALF
ncbi:MAG: NADH-quinone oxidoreductase subunit L [Verrucomicrobiae bacterium]|nr:NADH-quinone oxidoreductase subunit L [Verrucomicrobiae bacterium]